MLMSTSLKVRKKAKNRESIQSSTTPYQGHLIEVNNFILATSKGTDKTLLKHRSV